MNNSARTRRWPYIVASLPLLAMGIFYLFVAWFRLRSGAWPTYGSPDAGVFRGPTLIADIAIFTLLAAALLAIIPCACALASSFHHRFRWLSIPSAIGVLSWCTLIIVIWLDPGSYFNWFAD